MADLILYHISPSRSSIVLWMLEEVGEPYDVELLSMEKGENRAPAYLETVNPMGKVPALKHGEAVITEVAAICCYLADTFPDAKLAVPLSDPRRGPYLKWLFFAPGCLEPAIMDRTFPRAEEAPKTALGYGDFDTVMDVIAAAISPGPYLMGEQFTAADLVLGANLRWATHFELIPERDDFKPWFERLAARPASMRAEAKDAELKAA